MDANYEMTKLLKLSDKDFSHQKIAKKAIIKATENK